MRSLTNPWLAHNWGGRRGAGLDQRTVLGSPSKPGTRSMVTVRLTALALTLVLLGLLAPRMLTSAADDGALQTQEISFVRRSRLVSTEIDKRLEQSAGSIIPPKPDIAHRAGCCGAVSDFCPGSYPHLFVYVAVPNVWGRLAIYRHFTRWPPPHKQRARGPRGHLCPARAWPHASLQFKVGRPSKDKRLAHSARWKPHTGVAL
jgi:hypothetical protein